MEENGMSQLSTGVDVKPSPDWTTANGATPRTESGGASATPDAGSSEHQSPPAKRRREDKERTRVSRACDRCKKKKTRCSGRCPCALCLRSGLPCEFTASYTRGRLPSVIVDEAAMSLSTQHQRLVSEQASTPEKSTQTSTGQTFQFPRIYPSPNTETPIFNQSERLDVPNEITSRNNTSSRNSPEPSRVSIDPQGHYIGSSSAASFLLRIQKRLHQTSYLSHDSSIFTFGDAPLPEFDPTFFVLPPKPDAQRLVERYFDYAAPTHRFLHRQTIENLVEEFYETQGDMKSKEDAPAKTALLLCVFAQAQAYMPKGSTTKDNSARYFFAAEHQLAKERGAVRLASVQARLLQCFYLLTQSRINHCWSLFGTLSHLALAIGLNRGSRGRRGDTSGTIDFVELESRRRLFWCAYSLDKYLAAALGRPRTFKDEDIDQELPTIVNDNELKPNYINPTSSKSYSVMMAPVEHIKLTRIVSLVLRDLYSIRPPSLSLRIELSAKYTSELHAWRSSLSRFLNDDEGRGIDSHLLIPIYQRQRSVLNLAYYHAMLLIHRPFLLSNFASLNHMQTHPTFNASIDTSANMSSCVEAAMSIVRVVDDVFTSSNLFRSFWFTQYYAFCAVVVLYIHKLRQHIVTPDKCEDYFVAGQKCQRQLESVSESDCLARRYCLVLEELRLEAIRQTKGPNNRATTTVTTELAFPQEMGTDGTDKALASASLGVGQSDFTPQPDASPSGTQLYGAATTTNIPPTPESAVFNSNFLPNSNIMADLTSWGQFDSLVTSGFGTFDGAGLQGDGDFGNPFGFGM